VNLITNVCIRGLPLWEHTETLPGKKSASGRLEMSFMIVDRSMSPMTTCNSYSTW